VPLYQNLLNLFFTLLFIVFYSISVNTPNDKGVIDVTEGFLFAFALGFFFDEVTKVSRPPPPLPACISQRWTEADGVDIKAGS
jgi:hypothetical protein